MRFLVYLLVAGLGVPLVHAQESTPARKPSTGVTYFLADVVRDARQQPARSGPKSLTLKDALAIFLQQNLQIVAAKFDVDMADAKKLTAKLRPNPEFNIDSEGLPLDFSGPFFNGQEITYSLSQTFELGGKRKKRIDNANANAELARAEFETTMWQLTNDFKRKFYTVVLADSLVKLAEENQKTFDETVKHTRELYQLGEISGLDLRRLEVEKLKFDTDVANSRRDYEVALRDLRVGLGGDYRAMDVDVLG